MTDRLRIDETSRSQLGSERPLAVDVITVPDFTGEAAPRFELRTLLFLGSWMQHRGASRSWPLHLACVGEPPASVRQMAQLAGASVSIHPPMPALYPRTSNKLRGLEIAPSADRFLLLDTDTVILRDLAPIAQIAGSGICVGPVGANHIPERVWRRIYDFVGVSYPGHTGTCWYAKWDLSAHRKLTSEAMEQCLRMPPSYNSGVVMAAWSLGLGPLWHEHIRRILDGFAGDPEVSTAWWIHRSDQHGLSTAIEALRQAGARVSTLPLAYQVRPPLLIAGVLSWSEAALFHYVKALQPYGESVDGLLRLLYGRKLIRLRRWMAGRLGLAAIRSPVYRLVAPSRLRAYAGFFDVVHRIFRAFDLCGLRPPR